MPNDKEPEKLSAGDDLLGHGEAMTCSALCSLSGGGESGATAEQQTKTEPADDSAGKATRRKSSDSTSGKGCCVKQLQLPMFLSKTYHMIDKCDPEIATWSETGDNFVVKDLDKFAKTVLPMYFKHSNFSSFARQLNFYGFRKLRSDPILAADVDPSTSCYVRFYHEKFQRGQPELLQQIKRATKAEQHSKDDIDSLREEVCGLKDQLRNTVTDYDRKLAELSYECNRRISSMNAEYDKLLALVTSALGPKAAAVSAVPSTTTAALLPNSALDGAAAAAAAAAVPPAADGLQVPVNADLLHSLSQAAVSLQDNARANLAMAGTANGKRKTPSGAEGENIDQAKTAKV